MSDKVLDDEYEEVDDKELKKHEGKEPVAEGTEGIDKAKDVEVEDEKHEGDSPGEDGPEELKEGHDGVKEKEGKNE